MTTDLDLGERTLALKARLDAQTGATSEARTAARGTKPLVLIYKVMGKMFAILSVRGTEFVMLKCDPHLAEILREQYAGVGQRTHLDPRHWIAVDLAADVPMAEIERLADQSYALVCEGLTGKQRAKLAALAN
jgi:predicted DNA-binding protein (MmcQ/YjbR family)